MNESPNANEVLKIDVEQVLYSKNPKFKKTVPEIVIRYLKKIVHQDELNEFLKASGHLRDAKFIEAGLKFFDIKYNVFGKENIPLNGRYIFVSNHPLGGLDGLVFIYELSKYHKNIKFPVNDILMNIKNLSGIFLPVNKHGHRLKKQQTIRGSLFFLKPDTLLSGRIMFKKEKGVIKGPSMA
jgi:1-acyl-sn-glycerol-3-phosphate acyltransferase